MFALRNEALVRHSKIGSPSATIWLYLTGEFVIGGLLSAFLAVLGILKSFLPKPPRDLTGDVVLVAGASSTLGESLAEEFAKSGCTVICVDNDLRTAEEISSRLNLRYPKVEEIVPRHRKDNVPQQKSTTTAYGCDFLDRGDIQQTAKKIKDEVGGIDVLVTCVGNPDQDIFDTASTTLMSHYWTVLAFLPLMLDRGKGHIIGVTPITSSDDGYLGSRAAIAGLMESLGQELSHRDSHLSFLAISPVAESNSTRQSEEQVARDVVQAVRRDQCSLTVSWISKIIYRISCITYNAIATITQWIYVEGCDYSL